MNIQVDSDFVDTIRTGYKADPWCAKFDAITPSFVGLRFDNSLWYIGDRLIIPRSGNLHEHLYRLTTPSGISTSTSPTRLYVTLTIG
jgi:hypothetical protein